jgi:biotin operon repressor
MSRPAFPFPKVPPDAVHSVAQIRRRCPAAYDTLCYLSRIQFAECIEDAVLSEKVEDIASALGVDRRQVQRAISKLRGWGFVVTVIEGRGRGKTSTHQVKEFVIRELRAGGVL